VPDTRFDTAFPVAAAIALDLVRQPVVTDRWAAPSALPKMSVGALACHLGRQTVLAARLLPVPTAWAALADVDEHYARAAWVHASSPDDPANDRGNDDAEAALGPAALAERVTGALETVRGLLAGGAAQDVVAIPWQGWALRRDDFLLTRMLEIVVHSDDLAAGLGTDTPRFPDEVFAPVRDLLVRLAVRRHGQSAVVATLTRRERARPISAF
jgi:hypothetical protein